MMQSLREPSAIHQARRGGILLEAMVSIVLFVGAGSIVLGVTSNMLNRQHMQLRQQQTMDIARSLLAMLETGQISLEDIRAGLPRQLGSNEVFSEQVRERVETGLIGWSADIQTHRTEFPDLSLVELTVMETRGGMGPTSLQLDGSSDLISVTVRQIMHVRDADYEEFEVDDLIEGLPVSMTRTGASQ